MKYCFGIDIGGTTVKMGIFETDGTLVDKWEIVTRTENKGEAILSDIAKSIDEKCEQKGIDKADIEGLGIGIPAPVTKDGVVKNTANLGWGYKEVKREMEELTGFKVAVGNDANMATLGEMWLGAGRGHKDLVMVTLGTGVGGGVIVNGRPLTGVNGAGGEIGHILANRQELDKCGCGKKGCLEQYASATGIARLARLRLARNDDRSLLRDAERINAKAVFDALKEGDKVAEEIVEEFGAYLGYALADVAAIVDPSIVIIGGGVSKAGPIIIQYVKKYFLEKAFFANEGTEFIIAVLGNDAGICGAAKMILDEIA